MMCWFRSRGSVSEIDWNTRKYYSACAVQDYAYCDGVGGGVHEERTGGKMKSVMMKKIGTMDNGKFLCAIAAEEWERLQRREGARKNAAQRTASVRTILADS